MTLITRQSETFFRLVTSKGRTVEVSLNRAAGIVSVYIKANGLRRMAAGRHFHGADGLEQAIASYKTADVREALEALGAIA